MKNGIGCIGTGFLSASKLESCIGNLVNNSGSPTELSHYYFHRWPHRVSGLIEGTAETIEISSAEGQVFSQSWELRWKQKGEGFEALLLSTQNLLEDFEKLGQDWYWCDRPAKLYLKTETRFPKGFTYPNELDIAQRYFIDKATASVRFVALTF